MTALSRSVLLAMSLVGSLWAQSGAAGRIPAARLGVPERDGTDGKPQVPAPVLLADTKAPGGEEGVPQPEPPPRQVRLVYQTSGGNLCMTVRGDGMVTGLSTAEGLQVESCAVVGRKAKSIVVETRVENGRAIKRKLKLTPGEVGDLGRGITVRYGLRNMPRKARSTEVTRIHVVAVERKPDRAVDLPPAVAKFTAESLQLPRVAGAAELALTPPWARPVPVPFAGGELFAQVQPGTAASTADVAIVWKPSARASVSGSVTLWAGCPPAVFGPLDRRSGLALAIWAE